jgi:hypothetical protein
LPESGDVTSHYNQKARTTSPTLSDLVRNISSAGKVKLSTFTEDSTPPGSEDLATARLHYSYSFAALDPGVPVQDGVSQRYYSLGSF